MTCIASGLMPLFNDDGSIGNDPYAKDVSIASIFGDIRSDVRLDGAVRLDDPLKLPALLKRKPELVKEYASKWNVGGDEADIQRKLKELYITCAQAYTFSSRPNHLPKLDFFLMHALTSVYFLRLLILQVSHTKDKIQLLRAHFTVTLAYYIARGRPALFPVRPGNPRIPLKLSTAWLDIIHYSILNVDDHVPKVIRSLLVGEREYGEQDGLWEQGGLITRDTVHNHNGWEHQPVGFDEVWQD